MTTKSLKTFIKDLSREDLENMILNLSADADRLRRELDEALGVIR